MRAKNKIKICLLFFAMTFCFSFTNLKLQTFDVALTQNTWKILSYKTSATDKSKFPSRLFKKKEIYKVSFSNQGILRVNAMEWGRFSYEIRDKNKKQIKIAEAGMYPTVSDETMSESDMELNDLFLKTTNYSVKGDTLLLAGTGQIVLKRIPKKINSTKKKTN